MTQKTPVNRRLATSMAVTLLLCLSLGAGADGPAVLLMPFENASGLRQLDELASGMPDILTACFSRYPDQVTVIDRSSVTRAMNELGLSVEAYTDPQAQQRTGAVVGADLIVRGSFTGTNGEFKAAALAFNVTDATLVAAIEATLTGNAIIDQVCADVAGPMVAALARLPSRQAPAAVDDPLAQALMMEGLGYFYTNDYASAIEPFLKLLRLEPDNESAQYWLGRSFVGAGLNGLAAVQMQSYLKRFPTGRRRKEVEALLKTVNE